MKETDASYHIRPNSNLSHVILTQTPLENKVAAQSPTSGNRRGQPAQNSSVKQKGKTSNGKSDPNIESSWNERMSGLPKNSAYRSQIRFEEDGMVAAA